MTEQLITTETASKQFDMPESMFIDKCENIGFELITDKTETFVRISQLSYILKQRNRQEFKPQLHQYV